MIQGKIQLLEITSNLEISSSENFSVSLVDPSGLDAYLLLDPKGAGENGHAALIVGNKEAGYRSMSMGTMGGTFQQIFSGATLEGIDINKANSFGAALEIANKSANYSDILHIPTSSAQDKAMVNYADERFKQDARVGTNYSPFTNNCADFVRDTLKSGGIETERHMIPNDYFKAVDSKSDLPHYNLDGSGNRK